MEGIRVTPKEGPVKIQGTPAPTPPKGEGRRVVTGEEHVKGG